MRADYGFRTSGALELSREAQRKSVFFFLIPQTDFKIGWKKNINLTLKRPVHSNDRHTMMLSFPVLARLEGEFNKNYIFIRSLLIKSRYNKTQLKNKMTILSI